MATPTVGMLTFVGASGKTYSILTYTADTAAYINKMSAHTTAGATSSEYWRAPENVTLTDFSIPTGMTQTNMIMLQDGVVRNGTLVNIVTHVSTSPARPPLRVAFPHGSLIGMQTI